jgi:hypothetical protein
MATSLCTDHRAQTSTTRLGGADSWMGTPWRSGAYFSQITRRKRRRMMRKLLYWLRAAARRIVSSRCLQGAIVGVATGTLLVGGTALAATPSGPSATSSTTLVVAGSVSANCTQFYANPNYSAQKTPGKNTCELFFYESATSPQVIPSVQITPLGSGVSVISESDPTCSGSGCGLLYKLSSPARIIFTATPLGGKL